MFRSSQPARRTLGQVTLQSVTELRSLRTRSLLLHDGRATTIAAAIKLHAGQGAAARNRFLRLGLFDRFALLAFLRSL